jgi:hypothetical protein
MYCHGIHMRTKEKAMEKPLEYQAIGRDLNQDSPNITPVEEEIYQILGTSSTSSATLYGSSLRMERRLDRQSTYCVTLWCIRLTNAAGEKPQELHILSVCACV